MVFGSIGDTTRVSPLQNRARSGLLATHPLPPSAVSGAGILARSFFATVFPADCRLCASPLTNVSRLPLCEACIAAIGPICGPTCDACQEHSALNAMDHERFQLVTNLMERVRPTVSQIGLARTQRQDNLRSALEVPHLSRVRGGDILLGDDVLRTVTTAAECAMRFARSGREEHLGSNGRKDVGEFCRTKPGRRN